MPLKPEVLPILEVVEAGRAAEDERAPELLREGYTALSAMVRREDVASVEDSSFPGPGGDVPVRIYRPASRFSDDAAPVLVYFHGGGWVLGDLESHDAVCRSV